MVLVQERRIASVATGPALCALGLQKCTSAGSGGDRVTPCLGTTGAGAIPAGPPPQVHVVVPGHSHLDVVTAANIQNNGKPEEVSGTLADWASQIVGPPAP